MEIGATVLPHFPKDTTDRNRTSPFAFTGNKFEFRMLGSSLSISGPNIILNTAVAEVLREFADILEGSTDFKSDLAALIKKTIRTHKRIVFNGNNYSPEWITEAEQRGLLNLKTTVDALPAFILPKNAEMFQRHHVFTESELHSRYEILLESYCKTLHIEALTMIDLVKKEILPAPLSYQRELAALLKDKKDCGLDTVPEEFLLTKLSTLTGRLYGSLEKLEETVLNRKPLTDTLALAQYYRDAVSGCMTELRLIIDELETLVAKKHWPLPTYGEILYSVNE